MELNLTQLHTRAVDLSAALSSVPLGAERLRKAKQFKDQTVNEVRSFLQEFPSLAESGSFSEKDLAEMLGNTCLEAGSFLFAAGAPSETWREWTHCSAEAYLVERDLGLALELFVISKQVPVTDLAQRFRQSDLSGYRAQAILSIVTWAQLHQKPSLAPLDELDADYRTLVDAVELADVGAMSESVNRIVEFWLNETSYGTFEPGVFPAFEPEVNATVAALGSQGFEMKLSNPRSRRFLEAGLG